MVAGPPSPDPFSGYVPPASVRPQAVPATVLQFQISQNSPARIELADDVTQEALERLATILNAQKFVFPSEKQPAQPAVAQQPEPPAIEPRGLGQPALGLPEPK